MLGTTELIRRGNGRRLLAQRPAAGRRQVALQRQHVGEVGAPRAPAKVFRPAYQAAERRGRGGPSSRWPLRGTRASAPRVKVHGN